MSRSPWFVVLLDVQIVAGFREPPCSNRLIVFSYVGAARLSLSHPTKVMKGDENGDRYVMPFCSPFDKISCINPNFMNFKNLIMKERQFLRKRIYKIP